MAKIRQVNEQYLTSSPDPTDPRSRVEGPMAEAYEDILYAYNGLIVYSAADDKYYKVTNAIDGLIEPGGYEEWKQGGDPTPQVEVVDNLTSTAKDKALSANQGKVLKDLVDGKATGSVNETAKLLVVTAQSGKQYACAVSEYSKPATPTMTINGSDTSASRTVTIACTTSGATIQYSTDGGTTWVTGSSVTLTASTASKETSHTVKARATKNGLTSDIATQTYKTARHLAAPGISASGNEYSTSRTITLTQSDGADLYYTTDGTAPTTSSTKYSAAFSISSTKTIKVLAVKTDWQNSTNDSSFTVGTKKMYFGLVDSAPTSLTGLTAKEQKALPFTTDAFTSSDIKKVCFVYSSSLADLTSIKDANGTEYLSQFTKTTITGYKVYTMNSAADQNGMKYTFK